MTTEIFEYRKQARGPKNYLALALVLGVTYAAHLQGWGFAGILLCGPFFAWVLVRLIENDAEGFRMSEAGLDYYGGNISGEVEWHRLRGVTIGGDGAGGSLCQLHLGAGESETLPATAAFAPERLAQEFRLRGVPVWPAAKAQQVMARA